MPSTRPQHSSEKSRSAKPTPPDADTTTRAHNQPNAGPIEADKSGMPRGEATTPSSRESVIGRGFTWLATWSGRFVVVALAAVALGLLIKVTWVILLPVMLALVISSVLGPIANFLRFKLRFPAALAAAATLLGVIGIAVGVGFAMAPSVAGQSGEIVNSASKGLGQLQQWVKDSNFVSKDQIDTAIQGVQDKVSGSASKIASGVLVGVSTVTSIVVTLIITTILTFLFLKDGPNFRPWVQRISGPQAGPHLSEVCGRAWKTLGGFIRTQAVVSLIDAVFIGIGLIAVGVPLAIPLAVLTFFGGFIPIVGAFVAGAVAVLVALVSKGVVGALIILAVIVAVQQLEGNVLSPMLQSKSMNLHAAVVLLSVMLGSTLFGIVGAFLAVPVVATAAVILRYLDEQVTAATLRAEPPPPRVRVDSERSRGSRAKPSRWSRLLGRT